MNNYYEYKIKNGDTLSGIIHRMFGYLPNHARYTETLKHLLTLNPQIKNPHQIKYGDMLRLAVLPSTPQPTTRIAKTSQVQPPSFITEAIHPNDRDNFWALSWLEHNANYLTIPGSIAVGATGNLLSPGNVNLINAVSDHYADYKSGRTTKSQYDYRRKRTLDKLRANIGPFEKLMFGKNTTHQSIRIARSGGVPATAHISKHANRLKSVAAISKNSGIVLAGVGLTAACMQIANAADAQEKNEIFVETITSTTAGIGLGFAVGVFLVSNPIGWGSAIVLAVGSTALSYGAGKLTRLAYNKLGMQVDLVTGTGVSRICQ